MTQPKSSPAHDQGASEARDPQDMRAVRALYFAAARERVGAQEERLLISHPYLLTTLKSLIYQRHPELEPLDSYLRWAVNQRFVEEDQELRAGDEVALIPPISGG